MKILIPALLALCLSHSAYANPFLNSPKVSAKASPPITARLPAQVGKVSGVIPGDFVAGHKSEIVLGDKRGSLCYEASSRSYCVPILAKSYRDVVVKNLGAGLLLFTPNPASKVPVALAAKDFMVGLERAQASLTRHSTRPRPAQPSVVFGGDSCGYGDDDAFPTCEGGGSSGSGGGGWSGDYPGGGGEWGDPTGGSAAKFTGCVVTPMGYVCSATRVTPTPDPWVTPGQPSQQEPRNGTTWVPQSWCNKVPALCSEGQYPDNDRGPGTDTSGKTISQLYNICDAIAAVEYDVCAANRAAGADSRIYRACTSKVETRRANCYTTARELTDNGSHPAP